MASEASASATTTVIAARSGAMRLGELWEYRELLYFLTWRDIKLRYKQTAFGAAWAILQPLLGAVVFTIFFGRMAGIGADGLPYPVFAYAGMLVWTFFAQGLTQASNSLVGSANLITKVYFPRLVIPLAGVLAGLFDLAVASPVLAILMLHYGLPATSRLVLLPLILLLALLAALGFGLWLSALNVEYRDVRHAVPFLIQIWLFVTPVIYPASKLRPYLASHGVPAWVIGINPVAGVVEGFRWCVLGAPGDPTGIAVLSVVVAVAVLLSGALYFRRMERTFADVV